MDVDMYIVAARFPNGFEECPGAYREAFYLIIIIIIIIAIIIIIIIITQQCKTKACRTPKGA
jgi:tetrahydromethanopterin S-methyltransferase subunit B